MEISSLPIQPSPSRTVAAALEPAAVPEGKVGPPAPTTPPAAAGRDGVDVVTETHETTGATVTTIVSTETGEVIDEVPLRQVLDLIAFLLEQHRTHNEKGSHHGDH